MGSLIRVWESLRGVWKLKEWKGHSGRAWVGKLGVQEKRRGVGRFVVPTIKWTTEFGHTAHDDCKTRSHSHPGLA